MKHLFRTTLTLLAFSVAGLMAQAALPETASTQSPATATTTAKHHKKHHRKHARIKHTPAAAAGAAQSAPHS